MLFFIPFLAGVVLFYSFNYFPFTAVIVFLLASIYLCMQRRFLLIKLYTPLSLRGGNREAPFEKGVWGIIMLLQWNWERGLMRSIRFDTIW